MQLKANDVRLNWLGAVSLRIDDNGVKPWRIPHGIRGLFDPQLQLRAAMPAGVRLSFFSDTRTIEGQIEATAENNQIDLYCNGDYIATQGLQNTNQFQFRDLLAEQKLVELWLPQKGTFQLRSIGLSDGATIERFDSDRPRWIAYGSSITQCAAAQSPSYTWPAIVARQSAFNLTCLGFGGQCHLDPMLARLIRDLPADFISICCGINIYGAGSLGPRAFQQAIIGTVLTIRERHPNIPLALISPICSPPREETRNAVGFTLKAMREQVAEATEILKAHNDHNLFYFDGQTIFGADLVQYLPDQLHPDAEGYKFLAQNFQQQVIKTIFPGP